MTKRVMSLDIVFGPMFAGKSSYILSIVRRNAALGIPVLVIKPQIDQRYSVNAEVVTHDQTRTPCEVVQFLADAQITDYDVIIVEEAQFFSDLVPFVRRTVDSLSKRVILVGLDGDSERRPFGHLLECVPMADEIIKLKALCARCRNGTPALFTHRRTQNQDQVHVGGAEEYTPLCRRCYINESS
jgi:thymidine kinase